MKQLNLSQMEELNGGSLACAASIVGASLLVAGFFVVPGAGWALGLYAANAILGPTVAGVGIGTSC